MPIFDLYSKRQKRLRGDVPEVFEYDDIPEHLRVQIVHVWHEAIGEESDYQSVEENLYKIIHDVLCKEYGVFTLMPKLADGYSGNLKRYFLSCQDTEKVLDVVEQVFWSVENVTVNLSYSINAPRRLNPKDAVDELNARFLEHAIGYQYESGKIIRKDSEFLHAEVVKPALILLRDANYKGANEEFLNAHEHYKNGNHKECLNECLKAFESTMKAICHKRGWSYNETDTAKKLIDVCLSNGLVPSYLQTQATSLKSLLESGIPTVRNKLGGHGQGTQQIIVPQHFASYALHLTATTILFLIQSVEALP